jgi:LPXTG-site transpeptidase (sortase) family protein
MTDTEGIPSHSPDPPQDSKPISAGFSAFVVASGVVLMLVGVVIIGARVVEVIQLRQMELEAAGDGQGFTPYLSSSMECCAPTLETVPTSTGPDASADDQPQATPSTGAQPSPSPEAPPIIPRIPEQILIPAINVEAPIEPVSTFPMEVGSRTYEVWFAPRGYVAGWHDTSAMLGEQGNLVLNGHHNTRGEVFRDLIDLEVGDRVIISGDGLVREFQVVETLLFKERWERAGTRIENARWIEPTTDERVTLVTCWPYESNTHRLLIIAMPIGR